MRHRRLPLPAAALQENCFHHLLDPSAGQRFLSFYGVSQNARRDFQPKKSILCHGQRLRCQPGNQRPSEYDIKALESQASQRLAKTVVTVPHDDKKTRRFNISQLHCGIWDYGNDSRLIYHSHFSMGSRGTITFGSREAIVLLGNVGTDQTRMDFTYYSCQHVVFGDPREPYDTFTLQHSPKFYQVAGDDVLEEGFRALNLGPAAGLQSSIGKKRILGLNYAHRSVAGACRVYRFCLSEGSSLPKVRNLLQSNPKIPASYSLSTALLYPNLTLERSYRRLSIQLEDTAKYGKMPFQVRFQLDRLARNG